MQKKNFFITMGRLENPNMPNARQHNDHITDENIKRSATFTYKKA